MRTHPRVRERESSTDGNEIFIFDLSLPITGIYYYSQSISTLLVLAPEHYHVTLRAIEARTSCEGGKVRTATAELFSRANQIVVEEETSEWIDFHLFILRKLRMCLFRLCMHALPRARDLGIEKMHS